MIYLIGGSPRTGKTTLTQQISKQLHVSFASTDTLESKAAANTSHAELPKRFPKSVMRKETEQSNDALYTTHSSHEIVQAYLTQARAVHEEISTYVHNAVQEQPHVIVEGYHITPQLAQNIGTTLATRSLFLGRENVQDTESSIRVRTTENDWAHTKTTHADTFAGIARMICLFSSTIRTQAHECNLPYRTVDGDFQKKLHEYVNLLLDA